MRTAIENHHLVKLLQFAQANEQLVIAGHGSNWIETPYSDMIIGDMREPEFASVGTRATILGWACIMLARPGTRISGQGHEGTLISPAQLAQPAASLAADLLDLSHVEADWFSRNRPYDDVMAGLRLLLQRPYCTATDLDAAAAGFREMAAADDDDDDDDDETNPAILVLLLKILQRPDAEEVLRRAVAPPAPMGLNPVVVQDRLQKLYDAAVANPSVTAADVEKAADYFGIVLRTVQPLPGGPWAAMVYHGSTAVRIGLGGRGEDRSVRTCPVCRAYGGGGHGGGCPNASKPPEQWEDA